MRGFIDDSHILCACCDNKFSPWEDYTRDILFQELNPQMIRSSPTGRRRYTIPQYDYEATKLCLLSSDEAWAEYLYFNANPKGASREMWLHLTCMESFAMTRDTATHAVIGSEPLRAAP